MNRWYQLRRMRGAAYLILVGVLALLNEWHVMSWDQSWPMFLILAGLLSLAERAAWTADVRDQQDARNFAASAGPFGPTGSAGSMNPPAPPGWPGAAPSAVRSEPFIQTHPPMPEDTGRENR